MAQQSVVGQSFESYRGHNNAVVLVIAEGGGGGGVRHLI